MIREPVLAITRLKHLTGSATCLLACAAGLLVSAGIDPIGQLIVAALLVSWFLRRSFGHLMESLKRGVVLALVLYYMLATIVLLSLLAASEGDLREVIPLLLFCQLGLCPTIVVDWAYPALLFNSLLLVISASIIAPSGLPLLVVGFMLLMTWALLTRHQEQRLYDFAVSRPARAAPTLRGMLLVSLILLALQLAILPLFPDLRVPLSLLALPEINIAARGDSVLERFVNMALIIALGGMLVHFARKHFRRLKPEFRDLPPEGVEELFVEPEARGQTRRITRLRIFQNARERVVEEYCWLLRRLSGQGQHRPGFQTGKEFLAVVDRHRPEILPTLEELTGLFYRARYGPESITRQDVAEAQRLTQEILKKTP